MKIKIVPSDRWPGDTATMFGPVHLCGKGSDWLRATFPGGATLREAYEACPDGMWLWWVAHKLAELAGVSSEEIRRIGNAPLRPADFRTAVTFDEIDGYLRKVMAGRPEVIEP